MSKFFKALEQAEHDRALGPRLRQPEERTALASKAPAPAGGDSSVPTVTAPRTEPSPAVSPDTRSARREWATEEPSRGQADAPWGEVEEHLVSLLEPASHDAEQYRALRHAVEQIHRNGGLSVLAVASPAVGDGKTTTAINLAGALAQDRDASVLLIDADLRRGAAGARMGLRNFRERGLVDVILDPGLTLDDVVRRRQSFNLSVVPAGRLPAAPYEVLKSGRLGSLLDQARRQYDFIVLDTPPVVVAQDCRVIAKWVDGFLLVVAADQTPASLVEEALNRMEPSKIVGFVFNYDTRSLSHYYGYEYAPSRDRHPAGWWRRAMTRVAGSVRQRLSV
jgi:protein-tyrosine kinase